MRKKKRKNKKTASKQPQVTRTPNQLLIYRTIGIERHMFLQIDALDIKGYRGISGKLRYLTERGLRSLQEAQ